MLISLAEYAIYWVNAFPPSNGVSTSLSPANMYFFIKNRVKREKWILHIVQLADYFTKPLQGSLKDILGTID